MSKNRKQIKGNVIADGEVTGHAHRVEVPVYEGPDSTREFESDAETTVRHEEHKPITIPGGEWASGQVVETDHLTGMVNPVRD